MDTPDYRRQRDGMIRLLKERGISDSLVLHAMGRVERHSFLPDTGSVLGIENPYGDYPLPIGFAQTISQPYIVAYMLEKLELKHGERVLEIGTGSGYVAAVLFEMGVEVFTIEVVRELAERAGAVLDERVHIRRGDGYEGWPEEAPFDAIIVSCAPETVPEVCAEQLKDGGRMILPVGTHFQRLVIAVKRDNMLKFSDDLAVRFVPMVHS